MHPRLVGYNCTFSAAPCFRGGKSASLERLLHFHGTVAPPSFLSMHLAASFLANSLLACTHLQAFHQNSNLPCPANPKKMLVSIQELFDDLGFL